MCDRNSRFQSSIMSDLIFPSSHGGSARSIAHVHILRLPSLYMRKQGRASWLYDHVRCIRMTPERVDRSVKVRRETIDYEEESDDDLRTTTTTSCKIIN
ncbi:hypothetical protein EYF80_018973 [Liparis tanakae]|uniref:Uncharacterized protein n=1 Tax=Liparis tanakae TaxID=230148 RepID=A0A4Z2HYA9_9TELE|nr:hypothetical protein EYF80_018973 [Liparis tanakae]